MTKLLLTLGGAVTLASGAVSTLAENTQTVNSVLPQVDRIDYMFEEINESIELKHGQWVVYSIDNINLTKLGIDSVDKLHQYNNMYIPGFRLFADRRGYTEDNWNPKIRNIGEEGWVFQREIYDQGSRTEIYTAATLWNDESSNELMMRLSYKIFPLYYGLKKTVYFRTGTIIRFS